jgi:hypothetical protein
MTLVPKPLFITAGALLTMPAIAIATQGHGGTEGLYVHQLSHLFFCLSMGILIYWLKARSLTRETGWRYIGIAALLFLLWSLDAFIAHLLDEQLGIIQVRRIGSWDIQLDTEGIDSRFALFYYCAKLDHLFCVPAMILFYLGLRRLSIQAAADGNNGDVKETAQ